MPSYVDIFGGSAVQVANVSYLFLELTEDTTLSWPTQYQDTNKVVSNWIDVNPDQNGYSLRLPSAQLVSVGQNVIINNPSVYDFELLRNNGTLLSNIAAGNVLYFILVDNITIAGDWRVVPFGGGVAAVTQIDADVPDAIDAQNLQIAGVPITAAGTMSFSFAGDIEQLIGFGGSAGIAVRTGVEDWELRSVIPVPNGNVIVINQDGVAGNIQIDLAPNIGIVPSNPVNTMRVGNVTFAANTISSSNLNGNIELSPNGVGNIVLNSNSILNAGSSLAFNSADNAFSVSLSSNALDQNVVLTWPQAAPAAGQVLQFAGGVNLQWANVTTFFGVASTDQAIARFNGVAGQIQNSGVIIDNLNNVATPTSITAGTSLNTGTFAVSATNVLSTTAGNITISPVAGSTLNINTNTFIGTALLHRSLLFQRGAFTVSFTPPALTANVPLTLPAALPTANDQPLIGSAAGLLSFSPLSLPAAVPLIDNQILVGNIAGLLSFAPLTSVVATKVIMEAATSLINPVIPANLQYHPGVAKSWGSFVGATGVINSAYNAAVLRIGVGNYSVTFTTPFAAANYSIQVSLNPGAITVLGYTITAQTPALFQINVFTVPGVLIDPPSISFACFGTQ